jgi:hypothetical protein
MLRRYLIPAGYWSTLALSIIWLAVYMLEGGLVRAAVGVAFLSLSVALRALGTVKELQAEKNQKRENSKG